MTNIDQYLFILINNKLLMYFLSHFGNSSVHENRKFHFCTIIASIRPPTQPLVKLEQKSKPCYTSPRKTKK